jgi:S1-C subfamily serine protease
LVVAAVIWGGAASAQMSLPIEEHGRPTIAPLVRDVSPAIVNISVTSTGPSQENPLPNDPFFRRFFDIPVQQQAISEHVREVFEDDNRNSTGIFKLVSKLALRIQWVRIDDNEARFQSPEYHYWILQQIRHHDGNALAFRQF